MRSVESKTYSSGVTKPLRSLSSSAIGHSFSQIIPSRKDQSSITVGNLSHLNKFLDTHTFYPHKSCILVVKTETPAMSN